MTRRDKQNCAAVIWLLVFPNRLNGNGLLANKWRENVRYGITIIRWICSLPVMAAKPR